ncbi:hypothetical protein FG05_35284 [Fusarium graminearum]|nr:hypothetical protein FG05_35284 [Fusarium graminearum]
MYDEIVDFGLVSVSGRRVLCLLSVFGGVAGQRLVSTCMGADRSCQPRMTAPQPGLSLVNNAY